MALAGSRFDPEVMRRQAEEARERAKQKKTMAMIVNIAITIVVLGAGFGAWKWWQNRCENQKQQAQAEQEAKDRAEIQQAAQKAKSERDAKLRREAKEKAEREAKAKAEQEKKVRIEREKQAAAERKAESEREQREREEARKRAEAVQEEALRRRAYVDKNLSELRLDPRGHVIVRQGLETALDFEVDDKRWAELKKALENRAYVDFFELVRGKNVTNDFSVTSFPDRATFELMRTNLNMSIFHLVITKSASGFDLDKLDLVTLDTAKGLIVPPKRRELTDSAGRCTGWTVPFVFGGEPVLYVVEKSALPKLRADWKKITRGVKAPERAAAAQEFARILRLELSHAMKLEEPKQESSPKRDTKPRSGFKGTNSDIRSFKK